MQALVSGHSHANQSEFFSAPTVGRKGLEILRREGLSKSQKIAGSLLRQRAGKASTGYGFSVLAHLSSVGPGVDAGTQVGVG